MTGDERARFVRDQVYNTGSWEEAVKAIIKAWEDDVDDAFQRGQDAFREMAIPMAKVKTC